MFGSFLNFLQYEKQVCRNLPLQISNLEFEALITYIKLMVIFV